MYTGVLSWLCTIIILTCARKQAAQVALTHMKNKLENALETNSNLQISNLVRVQIWSCEGSHCEGHGFNKYLVQIVLILIFDSKYIIWKATHESKPKEQVCVIGKQMLPLWKDKASKGEKDNCVCEARKRLMTGDCWWTGMRRYQRMWNDCCQTPASLNGDHQLLSES